MGLGEWIGVAAVAIAIVVPLGIEAAKRPRLRIEKGEHVDHSDEPPRWRIVHVRVVNEPIRGPIGKLLLRNSAPGCEVSIWMKSRRDDKRLECLLGKWSATPEPLQRVQSGDSLIAIADRQKIGAATRYDVQPGGHGEPVAIAIKHDGDSEAYAYGIELYFGTGALRNPELALPDPEYEVYVEAVAGQRRTAEWFRLLNTGTDYNGLTVLTDDELFEERLAQDRPPRGEDQRG
jgi:hypothetical protein